MFKLAVLDIDGTLLDQAGAISPRVRAAIQAVHDRGCFVTLASGRRLWAVRPVVQALGIVTPVILYNGAVVYDLGREDALHLAALSGVVLQDAIGTIWDQGFQPVLYEDPLRGERVFTGPRHRENAATAHYFNRPTVQPVRLAQSGLSLACEPLLVAAMGEEAEVRALERVIVNAKIACQTLVEQQSFVPHSCWWQLDLMAPGCSKATALRRLCHLMNIATDETLAVGDGINDLELIRAAGLGIAMGNAVDEVRAAAQVVVADNGHDGAAEALERFVLAAAPGATVA